MSLARRLLEHELFSHSSMRGKLIDARKRFPWRKVQRLKRARIQSRALAVLSLPFVVRHGSIIPAKKSSLIEPRRAGEISQPPAGYPLRSKEYEKAQRRMYAPSAVSGITRHVARRVLPKPVAWLAWKASVCREREQRREVLLARKLVGRGVATGKVRNMTEKSKVRC